MIAFGGRLILLDIEGTVSPLAFVHEVMFPFARSGVRSFLERHWARPDVAGALGQMAADAGYASVAEWCARADSPAGAVPWIVRQVHELMDKDAKVTGLKQLQGLIWEEGFRIGELRSILFPDAVPAMQAWAKAGLGIRIYSSGSVHAQRLFFAHTEAGDFTPLLGGYYGTTTGPKKSAASYAAIAADTEVAPGEILFLSDVTEELDAAREAGMQTGLAIRPGNRDTPANGHRGFCSLEEIAI